MTFLWSCDLENTRNCHFKRSLYAELAKKIILVKNQMGMMSIIFLEHNRAGYGAL